MGTAIAAGVLFGILVLGLMGRMIVRGGYHGRLLSSRMSNIAFCSLRSSSTVIVSKRMRVAMNSSAWPGRSTGCTPPARK